MWTLEGKQNDCDPWTLIDSRDVTATPADALPAENTATKTFAIATEQQGTFQYFRFTVSKTGSDERLHRVEGPFYYEGGDDDYDDEAR